MITIESINIDNHGAKDSLNWKTESDSTIGTESVTELTNIDNSPPNLPWSTEKIGLITATFGLSLTCSCIFMIIKCIERTHRASVEHSKVSTEINVRKGTFL